MSIGLQMGQLKSVGLNLVNLLGMKKNSRSIERYTEHTTHVYR